MIGNALEWYDFSVYGYFVGAIGQHFFPRENHTAQLLAAFGVFAIGYMMRPIGGAVGCPIWPPPTPPTPRRSSGAATGGPRVLSPVLPTLAATVTRSALRVPPARHL